MTDFELHKVPKTPQKSRAKEESHRELAHYGNVLCS